MLNMPSGSGTTVQSQDEVELETSKLGKSGKGPSEDGEIERGSGNGFDADDEEIPEGPQKTETDTAHRFSNDVSNTANVDQRQSPGGGESGEHGGGGSYGAGKTNGMNGIGGDGGTNDHRINGDMSKLSLQDNLDIPTNRTNEKRSVSSSSVISDLMDTYLNSDYAAPVPRPKSRKCSDAIENQEELENNLKNISKPTKKQPPPPVRSKPQPGAKHWGDPLKKERPKNSEIQWPPKNPPSDATAYVSESYGQTDPYSKRLIKDIQKSKREEEERLAAEKRAEIVPESIKPVSTLRSTFSSKPAKPRPGVRRPEANLNEEKSWIKHEKKVMNYDAPPDEPDWMKLIRNRRWKSTVKARFPCKQSDKTDFERRSTTPKNWKRLAQDKNALKMLSEVVGIGAEGEELFLRLASQRQQLEEEQEKMDRLTEEELMAYEVARESLGEDAAYHLQMDNPLPAARMKHLGPNASVAEGCDGDESAITNKSSPANLYPFTTSQLEAAYLTNQLLRLHPEEFRKLMSLERSRQATLRWQFSADPFDSVHEHQSLPYEIAMLASQEPRVTQAMRKILAQGDDTSSYYAPRYARSEGYARSESEQDGYESSASTTGGLARGRSFKKKAPVPPPKKVRGRSVSPSMMRNNVSGKEHLNGPQIPDVPEISHSLFSEEDLIIGDEVAKLDELTTNLSRDIDQDLAQIESSIDDRKRGFFEEAVRRENVEKATNAFDAVDADEIASRRKDFIEKDHETSSPLDPKKNIPKQRHKVRRIKSNAELNAVFRKRRERSESDDEGDHEMPVPAEKANPALSNMVNDITNTFG